MSRTLAHSSLLKRPVSSKSRTSAVAKRLLFASLWLPIVINFFLLLLGGECLFAVIKVGVPPVHPKAGYWCRLTCRPCTLSGAAKRIIVVGTVVIAGDNPCHSGKQTRGT